MNNSRSYLRLDIIVISIIYIINNFFSSKTRTSNTF